jgi:hypothetical protein
MPYLLVRRKQNKKAEETKNKMENKAPPDLTDEESNMDFPELNITIDDFRMEEDTLQNLIPKTKEQKENPNDPWQANGDTVGRTQPNYRLAAGQEESFKSLRKLIYKRQLAQHYEAQIRKGLTEHRPLIKLQKPDLNLVEYNKVPTNFEENIQNILKRAEMDINEEVRNHYETLIPKLEEEWEFSLEECKTRFGIQATKEVIHRAKTVAADFLKRKLQPPKNENTFKRPRISHNPQSRRPNKQTIEDLLQILKSYSK